ncbi:hypothetical protein RCL1_007559 [Eukaryota sp. TZLM3-RCL]
MTSSDVENFRDLPQYKHYFLQANPTSTFHYETDEDGKFIRLFLAYDASIKGFEHCRPLITLDGTHLKTATKGVLLAACGTDSAGQIFPLAFGICRIENCEEWGFFMDKLSTLANFENVVFLSDRQKGLIDAVSSRFPNNPHGFCVKHLADNIKKKFRGKGLLNAVWSAARCSTVKDFNIAMNVIKTVNERAHNFLSELGVEKWANTHFVGSRYGHLTSNLSESLNKWLLEIRELPLIPLLEQIRCNLTEWINKRRDAALDLENKSQVIIPEMWKLVKDNLARGRAYEAMKVGNLDEKKVEVKSCNREINYEVNLDTNSCSCQQPKLDGYPCPHMCKACTLYNESPVKYVQDFYSISSYKASYAIGIQMVKSRVQWNRNELADLQEVLPPNFQKSIGRRRKKRFRGGPKMKKPRIYSEDELLERMMNGIFEEPNIEEQELLEAETEDERVEDDSIMDLGEPSPLDAVFSVLE